MAKPSLNYYQALHVGQVKTDVIQFTTIQGAINAITDNAAGKRYAVYVHPGTYTEQITMEDYVDLIAIGGREETRIVHAAPALTPNDPAVTGENSMIKGFTIVGDGTNDIARCVEAGTAGFEIDDCVLEITNPQGTEVALNATASFDMRNSVVDAGGNALTGINLATDAQTYNIRNCELGAGTNSLIVANNTLTLNMDICRVSNLIDKDGGTANIRGSELEEIDEDGGTLNLHETYVETIAADGGTVVAYGGTIRACSSSTGTSFVWWLTDDKLQVIANMVIAHALTAAAAGGIVIMIDPDTYAESNLTLVANVNLVGTDPEQCIISAGVANPILNSGVNCSISNLTITNTDAGGTAITVTANTITIHNCFINGTGVGDAIAMTGGTVTAYDSQVGAGDIDLSTGICTLSMYRCRVTTDPIDTAGAIAHVLVFEQCDFGNQNLASAATGATTLDMTGCSHVGQVSNAGTGVFTIRDSDVGDVTTTSTGDITVFGGDVGTCAAASVGGAIVWWLDSDAIKVIEGMRIDHALTAAAAGGIVIRLGQGTFGVSNLTAVDDVDIVGEGAGVSLIQATDGLNPIIAVGDNVTCRFFSVTIENLGANNAIDIAPVGNNSSVTVRDCYIASGADGVTLTTTGAGAPSFEAFNTEFSVTTTAIAVSGAVVADVDIHQCEFTCTNLATFTGANHTFDAWDCECGGGAVTVAANAPPINMTRCNDVGTITSLTNALTLEHCTTGNISTSTGAVTIESSNVGIVSSSGATTSNIYNSYITEINPAAGTWNLFDCQIGTVDSDGGSIVVHGGDIQVVDTPVTGTVVWWEGEHILKVMASTGNMKIADAIAVANAGDTIKVGQGTFAENNLAPATGVDIVGEGHEVSQIADNSGNPIFAIGNNISVTIRTVQISNAGAGGAITISPVANASALVLEDCDVVNAGASDCVTVSIGGAGNGTLTARRTSFTSDAANSIVVLAQTAGAGLLYFNSDLCTFTTSGGAGNAAIEASAAVVADVNVKRATFSDCTLAVYSTGANHTIDIDESDFTNCGIELAGNVPVVRLQECYDIGAFAHSVACTVNLYICQFTGTYTIGAIAGVVNAYQTQFSTFTNGGTGGISFAECSGTDINNNSTSTFEIEGGNWDTVLQGAGAGTINIYGAVIATQLDCSAPGSINALSCSIWDIDCNGGTIRLYGGQLTALSDVTGTVIWWEAPHRLRVIASTVNMRIMDAANAASAGDLIIIGPGTFTEALDLDAAGNACTYRGASREDTIITQTGNTVLVDGITGVVLEDMTIQATAGANGEYGLELDASTNASASVTLRNVVVDMTGTSDGVTVYGILVIDNGTRVGTLIAYDSYIEADTGNTNYAVAANPCTTATSTISLYDCILNGATYDIYNNYLVCDMHECELQGGGAYIANNAGAVCLAFNNEPMADPTPVVFAGAAGVFADLTGCELWSCSGATEALYEWVYVSGVDTVDEADADGASTYPSVGVIVYKPSDTTCYIKKHGYLYKPGAGWTAGQIQYLSTTAGAETATRPSNAVVQKLGVAKNATTMLVNVDIVENPTKWLSIPIAWGAGTAPIGTHVNGNSRRAVAIVGAAGQTVFSQMVAVPEDFLTFSKLYVTVFPTGNGSFDWTAYSSAASSGEAEDTHSDTATADGQAVTDNQILDHDISAAADGYTMVEQDKFSVEIIVDVLTTITQLCVLGFKLEYVAQYGS